MSPFSFIVENSVSFVTRTPMRYCCVLRSSIDPQILIYSRLRNEFQGLEKITLFTSIEPGHPCRSDFPMAEIRRFSSQRLAILYTDMGTKQKLEGNMGACIESYKQAIACDPSFSPAFYNLGVVYAETDRISEALTNYQMTVTLNPLYVEAYCNMGVISKNMGQIEDAIKFFTAALAVNQNFEIAKTNLSISLTDLGAKFKSQGKSKEAIAAYKRSLFYNSKNADSYYNLGVAYGDLMKFERAIVNYEISLEFNPGCCEALNNLGVIHKELNNLEKALQCYQQGLKINPRFTQTLNNVGVIYTIQGKTEEAYRSLHKAIEENPNYGEAYNNLGVLYRDEGRIEESLECYAKCLDCNPNSRNAAQNFLLATNYSLNPEIVKNSFDYHKKWGTQMEAFFPKIQTHLFKLKFPKKLRIGYISPDFFTHSVSYFSEAILKHHNPDQFRIYCYSNVTCEDAKTQRLKEMVEFWRDIRAMSAEEAVKHVVNDKIDILIELTGHTAGNRLDVMALKPAPIQITYIGYPNTTGLSTIDYRLTDKIVDPPETGQKFTENLIYLPNCFLCYSPPPNYERVPESIVEGSIPAVANGYVTFGTFNNLAKINEQVVAAWCEILRAVPNSKLMLKCKPFVSEDIRNRVLARFEREGIATNRIILLSLVSLTGEHLMTYRQMDIALDTFPYAGTTTTCEAMWMGVPVITMKGDTHAQNVGATLLTHVGHPELIAGSREEYRTIAEGLASDIPRLQQIKFALREKMRQSPLCQAAAFTKDYEAVLVDLWKRYIQSRQTQSSTIQ
eukprot:TRINITY_DN8305_c0_g1_i2.p1 TRINITY_DN8305_c0_g1~~TRINITY_DN8305_c0_g1_i2.p1  ORF type:complete len:788 (-),score=168.81 TRINITY_DN8305_c0_g1_i2:37-2400(-)